MLRSAKTLLFGAALVVVGACEDGNFGRSPSPTTTSAQRVATFRADLSRHPSDLKALLGIGEEYSRLAFWSKASGAYNEALIVDGGNRQAKLGYSVAQSALGQFASALQHANGALQQKADVEAYIVTAVALNGQGRHAEAKAMLDGALDINARDLDVRNNLALTLALMRDPRAYTVQRSVALAPDSDFRHHRNFYLVAAMMGQEGGAIRDGQGLSLSDSEIKAVTAVGRKARTQGMAAFGLATKF